MVPRKTTTRARLITTAAELFRRQGYAQTGVNQIIQEASATSGSFYHFFPAKEDLLLAVVDHIADVFERGIFAPAAERSDDPIDEIFTILDLYRQQLSAEGFTFGSPMAGLSTEVSENHPQIRVRLAEIFTEWSGRIEELLRRAGNHLAPGLDHTALAQLILCTTEGAVLGVRLNRSLAPFDSAISQIRSYFDLLENRVGATATVATAGRPDHITSQVSDWRSW
ncbi:MAG: TetR/AcrR family transcriptional regulator [Acidobacteriota bacterium]|nr:TetR/AcrR family transcriptional regulator [Acidobacteriota bacterium]